MMSRRRGSVNVAGAALPCPDAVRRRLCTSLEYELWQKAVGAAPPTPVDGSKSPLTKEKTSCSTDANSRSLARNKTHGSTRSHSRSPVRDVGAKRAAKAGTKLESELTETTDKQPDQADRSLAPSAPPSELARTSHSASPRCKAHVTLPQAQGLKPESAFKTPLHRVRRSDLLAARTLTASTSRPGKTVPATSWSKPSHVERPEIARCETRSESPHRSSAPATPHAGAKTSCSTSRPEVARCESRSASPPLKARRHKLQSAFLRAPADAQKHHFPVAGTPCSVPTPTSRWPDAASRNSSLWHEKKGSSLAGTPCPAAAPPVDAARVVSDKARASQQCNAAVERKLCTSLEYELWEKALIRSRRCFSSLPSSVAAASARKETMLTLRGSESCTRTITRAPSEERPSAHFPRVARLPSPAARSLRASKASGRAAKTTSDRAVVDKVEAWLASPRQRRTGISPASCESLTSTEASDASGSVCSIQWSEALGSLLPQLVMVMCVWILGVGTWVATSALEEATRA
jgi:hypothetical protein